MEKTLSPEERVRRAEEIYYKKKNENTNRNSARVNVSNKKDFGMLKKMFLQIIICILIYIILYMIQNTNYIFSDTVIQKVNEILSYDINIKNLYEQGMKYLNGFIDDVEGAPLGNPQNEIDSNIINETENNEAEASESVDSIEEQNIGGENIEVIEQTPEETQGKTETLSQMEQDAKKILENKSLIIPLKGTITSRFGLRDPQTPTVPKNHTGIDIAVNEGTVFIASMSGMVEEVSNER